MLPCPYKPNGKLPHGIEEIRRVYGDPRPFVTRKAEWEAKVLATRELPTPLKYAYEPDGYRIGRVRAHKLVVDELVAALMACLDAGVPRERLKYGGAYIWRAIRGSSSLSTHTWGIAVDIEPAENPLGKAWVDNGIMLDPRVIKIFQRRGWQWGGLWKRPDPQHFQLATGY